jgi:hypothetical protein
MQQRCGYVIPYDPHIMSEPGCHVCVLLDRHEGDHLCNVGGKWIAWQYQFCGECNPEDCECTLWGEVKGESLAELIPCPLVVAAKR